MLNGLRYERRDDELIARVVAMKRAKAIREVSFSVDPSPSDVADLGRRIVASGRVS